MEELEESESSVTTENFSAITTLIYLQVKVLFLRYLRVVAMIKSHLSAASFLRINRMWFIEGTVQQAVCLHYFLRNNIIFYIEVDHVYS